MGLDLAALMGLFGMTSAFALVGTALAAWMAWRIVEKSGLPGWTGLGAILLTLTGIGLIVPLILLWVFAFMRWPRDEASTATTGFAPAAGGRPASPAPASPTPGSPPPAALAPPPMALPDARGWRLGGMLASGGSVSIAVDGAPMTYSLTGAPALAPSDLSVPDPSVGQPHARLLTAGRRLGLEDLGNGETYIDGARLLPEHGPRDISAARSIRLGSVDLALTRA